MGELVRAKWLFSIGGDIGLLLLIHSVLVTVALAILGTFSVLSNPSSVWHYLLW